MDEGKRTGAPISPLSRSQKWALGLLALTLLAAQIDPPFPETAALHHLPTFALLVASPFLLRRWPLSDGATWCVAIFLILQTIGGRYTYTNVPYDDVFRALTGTTLSDIFGFSRNHYDRLVHFAYGLLAVRPVAEVLRRHAGIPPRIALYIAFESVLAISALYEIFEWLLTLVMTGAVSAAYNGQQGDMWDAQKDMALAAIGALTAVIFLKWKARDND